MSILSFVDKTQLEPGCTVLLHNKVMSVVGILSDEADPMVSVMKVWKGERGGDSRRNQHHTDPPFVSSCGIVVVD